MKLAKGFTLIELMVTVAILAIIAAVAIPAYNGYVTRSKISEAVSHLSSTRVTLEQYYQDNRTYQTSPVNGTQCGVAMPAAPDAKYFDFTCAAATSNTYVITATGHDSMAGFAYTVDEQNAKTSNITAPATTTGWSNPNPNNCWTTNKGGTC
jgi:prepilin-type N-terminal cleavage/methylation domain-containing protein